MVNKRSRNYLKSRNTLIMFVVLFLVFIICFKFGVGLIVDNIIIYTGTLIESGNINPSKFKIGWDSLDFSKLNPMLWQLENVKESINESLHELVDLIAPAVINLISMVVAQTVLLKRSAELNPMMLYSLSDAFI